MLLRAEDEQTYRQAVTRGSAMLLGIAAPVPKPETLWHSRYFLIQCDNKTTGYIGVSETAESRRGHPGVSMKCEKWIFMPGRAEYEVQNAYASWDLREDEWASHTETVVDPGLTPPGQPARRANLVTFDQKTRRLGRQLLMEVTNPKNRSKPINCVVPCPRNFMPAAWQWVLPRLMFKRLESSPKAAGQWLAVVNYSPARQGLQIMMLSRAVYGKIRQIVQRDGLYGDSETWQFDVDGKVSQISTVDFRLVPTTKAEVDRRFAGEIALWRHKVNPTQKTAAAHKP